jgi:hypothetical protein
MNENPNKPAPLSDFERGRRIGRVEGMIAFHKRYIENMKKENALMKKITYKEFISMQLKLRPYMDVSKHENPFDVGFFIKNKNNKNNMSINLWYCKMTEKATITVYNSKYPPAERYHTGKSYTSMKEYLIDIDKEIDKLF